MVGSLNQPTTPAPELSPPSTLIRMSGIRTVVLVEGVSDQAALGALAKRLGKNLEAEGVSIVAMGGARRSVIPSRASWSSTVPM